MQLKSLVEFVSESLEKPPKIQMDLRHKYEDCIEKLFIFQKENGLELNLIRIKPEKRGKGCATKIIKDLIDYADSNNMIIHLTPSKDFGASLDRLTSFYKSFGFVYNKAKNKDFRFKSTMIKYPNK